MTDHRLISSIARDLYAVYCASSDGKNFQGNPWPTWDALPDAVRGHWCTVARRASQLACAAVAAWEPGTLTNGMARAAVERQPDTYTVGHLSEPEIALKTWGAYAGVAP